jgi:putative spermidine/putrescine transport system permease protein
MNRRPLRYWLQLALTLAVCAFLVVPVVMSILAGVTQNYFIGIKSGLTLRWVVEVWTLYSDTIWRSIYVALATLGVTLVLGIPAAYALARAQSRWTRWVEELLTLPIAVPGLATALALILLYGQWRDFRSSWPLHPRRPRALHAAVHGALGARGDARRRPEDARRGGGEPGGVVQGPVLRRDPSNVRPGTLAGSLMVVTLSMGEFNLTWMLHTPLTKTLPVGLADSYASMRLEIGSAYTLIFLFMIVPLLIAMQWACGPRGAQVAMAIAIHLLDLREDLRRWHSRARAADPRHQGWRDRGAAGSLGLREDDDASHHRGPRIARSGWARSLRRRRRHRAADRGARRRNGFPELRALSEHDRRAKRGLRPARPEGIARRPRQARGRDARAR